MAIDVTQWIFLGRGECVSNKFFRQYVLYIDKYVDDTRVYCFVLII